MDIDHIYYGVVDAGTWNYWHLQYFSTSSLNITVSQQNDGDCDLYIRKNADPTRTFYQQLDISHSDTFSLIIEEPNNDIWHIGVYGWAKCEYQLIAEEVGKYYIYICLFMLILYFLKKKIVNVLIAVMVIVKKEVRNVFVIWDMLVTHVLYVSLFFLKIFNFVC